MRVLLFGKRQAVPGCDWTARRGVSSLRRTHPAYGVHQKHMYVGDSISQCLFRQPAGITTTNDHPGRNPRSSGRLSSRGPGRIGFVFPDGTAAHVILVDKGTDELNIGGVFFFQIFSPPVRQVATINPDFRDGEKSVIE